MRGERNVGRVAVLAALFLLGGAVLPAPRAAEDTAVLVGTLLAPGGLPAEGIRAVVEDVESREEFLSTTSDARGEYNVRVPIGRRYRVVAAITPDGERIPIRGAAPIPVRVPGSYRLPDVLFRETEAIEPPVPPPTAPSAPPAAAPPRPWYRRPGGITGIALGAVTLAAFGSSGGNGPTGSPANP